MWPHCEICKAITWKCVQCSSCTFSIIFSCTLRGNTITVIGPPTRIIIFRSKQDYGSSLPILSEFKNSEIQFLRNLCIDPFCFCKHILNGLSLPFLRNRQHFLSTIYLVKFYTFEIHTKITWVSWTLSKLSTVLNRTVNMPLCFAYKQQTWSVIITLHSPYSTSPESKTVLRMHCH